MNEYLFKAYALSGETDLNRLAANLKINKKFTWDEPLVLDPRTLSLPGGEFDSCRVYLYSFGAMVFFNCDDEKITSFLSRMTSLNELFHLVIDSAFSESYSLKVRQGAQMTVTNDHAIMQKEEQVYLDIICYTLAKSVALEQIESRLEIVFDRMEEIIARLGRGELALSDKTMARTAATILDFKYRSISYVMVLDKPEITWESEEADRLYTTIAGLFELDLRYSQIKHKSDTLLDINSVFSGLSHARRSARLEWIIIVLIALEIALFLLEMVRR